MIARKTLAEEMAEELREGILAGAWKAGEVLPTEGELGGRFGVSRAVVHDATRLLAAWGLVDARQGKGVYVSSDQRKGFDSALLLALRREGGSVWEVEEFQRILYPEAAAMAALRSEDIDHGRLSSLLESYGRAIREQMRDAPGENWYTDAVRDSWYEFIDEFLSCSGNRIITYFGSALARVRNVRVFEGDGDSDPEAASLRETREIRRILKAVKKGDPEKARIRTRAMLDLPPEAEGPIRAAPVGAAASIPVNLADFLSIRKGRKPGVESRRQ
jgi:DNA-binding FadR family transcriptional regulator